MSGAWWDAIVRHQLRLDGAAAGLAGDIVRDLSAALADLDTELAYRKPESAPFTVARLAMHRPQLAALRERLITRIGGSIDAATEAAADTSVEAVREAMGRLKDITIDLGVNGATASAAISFTAPSVAQLVAARSLPFDGAGWPEWGTRLANDTMQRVASELTQAASLGEPLPAVRKRLERVAGLGRVSAERLSRTCLTAVSANANMATYDSNANVIGKVRWLSVLDSRTSILCAGLSGQEWPLGDPAIRRPPAHPRCRSVLVPATKSWTELFGPDAAALPEMPEGQQASQDGPVPADWTYADWLRRQPAAFQREVLGPSRYEAFAAGVPLEGMATYSRPLSVQELRAHYPNAVQNR